MIDRYRGYQPSRPYAREETSRRSRTIRRVVTLVVLAVIVIVAMQIFSKKEVPESQKPTNSENSVAKKKVPVFAEAISDTKWTELSAAMNEAIAKYPDYDISVAIIDLGTKTKANYGIQDNFVGASTTKVLSAVTYLDRVQQGKRSLSQDVGGKPAKTQLELMINESNNEAWQAINGNLGHSALEQYAHGLGLTSYSASENVITAGDEAVLLQKLYSYTLLNETNTKLLLSYMVNTNNEDMVPMAAPDDAVVYHKYGQLDDRLHDASIVAYKDTPVVLVIYTKGGPADGAGYGSRARLVRDLAAKALDIIYK